MCESKYYSNLTKVTQAIEIGTTLHYSWFRGQPKTFGNLTPGIFRDGYPLLSEVTGENTELRITEKFKQRAPSFIDTIPGKRDYLEWLFLMQHHGAPTRLLDWTENILVALYFAANNNYNEDGELWVINPNKLNLCSIKRCGIELSVSSYVKFLANIPFHNNPEELKEELDINRSIEGPIAFYPPLNFIRMINQMSVVTIHPDPKSSNTVSQLLDDNHVVRYRIPQDSKKDILMDLHNIGIRESTLFPGLDALSNSIKRETKNRKMAYSQPPKFDE